MFNFSRRVQTDMHASCWLFHSHYINETKKEKPRRVIAKVRFHLYVWSKVLVSTPSLFHLSQTFRYHNIHWTHCFVSCAPGDTFWKITQHCFTDGLPKNLSVLRKTAIYSGKSLKQIKHTHVQLCPCSMLQWDRLFIFGNVPKVVLLCNVKRVHKRKTT